jgi:hypothetical protein
MPVQRQEGAPPAKIGKKVNPAYRKWWINNTAGGKAWNTRVLASRKAQRATRRKAAGKPPLGPHKDSPPWLVDSKRNPEYSKWWDKNTEAGKASAARRNNTVLSLEQIERRKVRRRALYADQVAAGVKLPGRERSRVKERENHPMGFRTCLGCGSKYDAADVLCRGWPLKGPRFTICDLCR